MAYIPENWSELEAPGLRKIFDGVYRQQTSNIPVLFNMQKSSKAQEFDLQTDDKSSWIELEGDIKYEDEVQGYKKTYTHAEYVNGKKIQKKLIDDDLYGVIERIPRKMAIGARRRRERDGASVYNNSFNAGFTGGDSLALCSTAHTSLNSTSTRSNSGTLSLTPANVETTRRNMVKTKSGADEFIDVTPDMLIVPLELEEAAWTIINTKGKVDTANNNANFHMGKYKLLVWQNYLTSSTRWWMVDSTYMKEFLLWFDRLPVQFFKDRDFGTLISAFAGYMRYSFGWSDWIWVFGQNP